MLIREPRLVGEGVDGMDTDLTPPTVGPWGSDWVADTAVHQPPWTALVEALVPGGVYLSGGGQRGVELAAVLHSLIVGEAVIVAGEEDLAWTSQERKYGGCSLTLSTGSGGSGPYLANVPQNRRRRTVRLLVSARMSGPRGGVAGSLHSFLWVIRWDT